jgi:hypothetical protein
VQTTNVPPGGDCQLALLFSPSPTNDDFANSTKLAGMRTHILASNAGATKEPGEPDHLGNPGGSSVWYSWTAPASGRVTLSTNDIPPYLPPSWTGGVVITISPNLRPPICGMEIDQNPPPPFFPVFAAYTGTNVISLVPAGNCQPMNLDAYPHAVEFDAIKGQTYQIVFDGNKGTTRRTPLYLVLTKPAANDSFMNRIKLRGIYALATGFNAGATHEPGEPVPAGSTGKTVWWTWTAPVGGGVTIDLGGSDYSFPVAVFTGSRVANLNLAGEGTGGVTFEAVQGQTYQIAVSDLAGLTGAIKMKLQAPVVELDLLRAWRFSAQIAVLEYRAAAGQKILLQRSTDGTLWQDMSTAVAGRKSVSFLVRPAPGVDGPYYRAIIVDSVAR